MDLEERRQAMLRQRGELIEPEDELEDESSQISRSRRGGLFHTYKKQEGQNQRTLSLSERRELARRKRRRESTIRLTLYIAALVILAAVVAVTVRGCSEKKGDSGQTMPESTQAMPEGTGQADGETGADPETGEDPESGESKDTEAQMTGEQDENSDDAANGQTEGINDIVNGSDEPESVVEANAGINVEMPTPGAVTVRQTQNGPTANPVASAETGWIDISNIVMPDWIDQEFIRVNPYSRPQAPLTEVKYIAIHYVANPGSTAMGNREYFDNLGNPDDPYYGNRQASAQFIVGLEGEVVQCMPLNELAYAVRSFNPYTISIEVCHPDDTGKFSDVSLESVKKLASWLMQQFGLDGETCLLRHYDCDQKNCPKYYVENPDAWLELKQSIIDYCNTHPNIQ